MARYRKIPVEIDAEQYLEYGKLVMGMCNSLSCFSAGNNEPHVHTIHGGQLVNLEIGDWIIPECDGEHFYPCKPEVFDATYRPVMQDHTSDCAVCRAPAFRTGPCDCGFVNENCN